MIYMGGKKKAAKAILSIVLKDRLPNQVYVEPFVGGGNIFESASNPRIGYDLNKYAISCLKASRDGYIYPNSLSKEEYQDIKLNKESYPDHIVGYVGFCCSFGGKFFGGLSGKTKTRNYIDEASRHMMKQGKKLVGASLHTLCYTDIELPDNSIIYCDPPYRSTTGYNKSDFNHDEFWEWCRNMSKKGHSVFISEYTAPEDFECIWEKKLKCTLNKSNVRTEKLFKFKEK